MKAATFSFVGTSVLNNVMRVRFANSATRNAVLKRNGHTHINFIQLEQGEREEDCVEALLKADYIKHDINAQRAVERAAAKLGFAEYAQFATMGEVDVTIGQDTFDNGMDNKHIAA